MSERLNCCAEQGGDIQLWSGLHGVMHRKRCSVYLMRVLVLTFLWRVQEAQPRYTLRHRREMLARYAPCSLRVPALLVGVQITELCHCILRLNVTVSRQYDACFIKEVRTQMLHFAHECSLHDLRL